MFQSESLVKGTVNIIVRDANNKVKQHKTIRNKVMNQGIAHIVGRMIDPGQNGAAYGTENGTFKKSSAFATPGQTHDIPAMMRYMGIGTGDQANATGSVTIGDSTAIQTANQTPATAVKGTEYRLLNELTAGTGTQNYAQVISSGSTGHGSKNGRVDMGNNTSATLIDATVASATQLADVTVQGTIVSRSDVTDLYQGGLNGSGILAPDLGTSEGVITSYATGTDLGTHRTIDSNYQISGSNPKRLGTKLVFIALWPPYAPSISATPVAITEAGIFNNPDATSTDVTMLCRTHFAPVNKYQEDSLQITWTIDFQDATPAP
jgi:hypothetical protein